MKTSSTCVFLVKSKCDTQISVFCHLFLLPTHHDAPAQIIVENLCSWLVSVGYTVFLSWSTWGQSPLCPSHSKMLWWFWHHQLQAIASRHGGGVTSAASHTATIATMINGLSNTVMSSLSPEVVTMPPYTKDVRALDGSSPSSSRFFHLHAFCSA